MKLNLPTKMSYFKSDTLTSIEMSHKLIENVNFVGAFIGTNIFSPNLSFKNPVLILIISNIITYHLISFENMHAFKDDFLRLMFVILTLPMGSQCSVKLYTFVIKRERILKLLSLAEGLHQSSTSRKAAESFEKWMLISCHVACLLTIVLYSCAVLVFIYPAIVYLVTKKRILHFGFVIPGIDYETTIGYIINFGHHTFQIYHVIFKLAMSSVLCVFFMFNALAQYDALETIVDELDELGISNENNKNDDKIQRCIAELTEGHVKLLE